MSSASSSASSSDNDTAHRGRVIADTSVRARKQGRTVTEKTKEPSRRNRSPTGDENNEKSTTTGTTTTGTTTTTTSRSKNAGKTTAAATRKRKSTTASTTDSEDNADADVTVALLGPSRKGGRAAPPPGSSPAPREPALKKAKPAAAAKKTTTTKANPAPIKRNAGSSGRTDGGRKKRKSTTATSGSGSISDEDDDDDSPRVRSVSSRGYTWEAESVQFAPEDVPRYLEYHKSIRTEVERDGVTYEVKFSRQDQIYLLPDPTELPSLSEEIDQTQLDWSDWWVGEILDCCTFRPRGQDEDPLGVLRIRWFYSPDDLKAVKTLHKSYDKQVQSYRFDRDEMIVSDHVDFVGIDAYGGGADHLFCYLSLTGLEVKDDERMKPEARRKKSTRTTMLRGFQKKKADEKEAARSSRR